MDTEKRIDLLAIAGLIGVYCGVLTWKAIRVTNKRIDDIVKYNDEFNGAQVVINSIEDTRIKKINDKIKRLTEEVEKLQQS